MKFTSGDVIAIAYCLSIHNKVYEGETLKSVVILASAIIIVSLLTGILDGLGWIKYNE